MNTYTFRVSLTDDPSIWRRVQLTGEQTLRDLHVAIQEALDWEPDDDIVFVVGDQAAEKEYIVFGEDEDDDEDDGYEDLFTGREDEEVVEAALNQMPPIDFGDTPPPQSLEEVAALVESNSEFRAQIATVLSEQFSIPRFMVDMLLQNLGELEKMVGEGVPDEESVADAGDAGQAPLDELALAPDHKMVYVYGDEEWLFDVAVEAVEPVDQLRGEYPMILDGEGDAPEQFAFWGDDDEGEWDDADEDEDY